MKAMKTYLINGLWLFFLTLVPFTTGWVGSAADAALPEFLYPLNLLLWSAVFHLLDIQILKDNKSAEKDSSTRAFDRVFMYVGYVICMIVAFIKPVWSLYIISLVTVVMIVRIFTANQ